MSTVVTSTTSGPYAASNQTNFPITFQSAGPGQIDMFLNGDLVSPSSYTFNRNADGTGTAVFNTPVSGQVFAQSNPSFQETAEFNKHGAFYPNQLNPIIDRMARRDLYLKNGLTQERADRIAAITAEALARLNGDTAEAEARAVAMHGLMSRSLRAPVGETVGELPAATVRANKFMQWSGSGGSLNMLSASAMATVLTPDLITALGVGFKGLPGSPGEGYPLRAHIKALTPTDFDDVYLTEPGREGKFIFSAIDHSADVAVDIREGIFIAPASDPTGASGAWVRQGTEGGFFVRWFGAKGDGFTDDSGAFLGAMATLGALALIQTGTPYKGSTRLRTGRGHFFMGTTPLDIRQTMILEGESVGMAGGTASLLQWADAAPYGIAIQRFNTIGIDGVSGVTLGAGDGTIIRNLAIAGANTGVNGTQHAVVFRARGMVEDCIIGGWRGHGVYSNAAGGSGGPAEGNSNGSALNRVRIAGCNKGVFIDGPDANVWVTNQLDLVSNRGDGLHDSSFLGNTHIQPHAAGNGGAPYRTDEAVSRNLFLNPYSELGDNPSVMVEPTLVIGGSLQSGLDGDAVHLKVTLGSLDIRRLAVSEIFQATLARGNFQQIADGTFDKFLNANFNNSQASTTGANAGVTVYNDGASVYGMGLGWLAAYGFVTRMFAPDSRGVSLAVHTANPTGQSSFADVLVASLLGADLRQGVYRVNGVQVLGARQPAIADLTGGDDLNATQLKVNAVLAMLRTHGLIAP